MSARALKEAGFGPLVCVTTPDAELHPSSCIDPKHRGKAPGLLREDGFWTGYAFTRTAVEPAQIEEWGANVGLLGDNFPGLDIDCDNAILAQAVQELAERHLGFTAVRLSREPRRLLVYRTAKPFARIGLVLTWKEKSHLVEFLGAGRQYLVHGKHPAGVDYRWDGQDLWDYLPSDIPEIDADKASAFLVAVKLEMEKYQVECELVGKATEKSDAPAKPQEDLEAPSIEALEALVKELPNPAEWDRSRYVQVACAIKASGGEEGRALFYDWAGRWTGGPPDLDHDEKTFDSLHPPYRVGWSWLQEQASALTDYCGAADVFDSIEEPETPAEEDRKATGFTPIRVTDFLATSRPEVKWRVEGMLPEGTMSLLVARPKVGKTTLARSLAVAISKGQSWLERETAKCPVFYVSLEDPEQLVDEEMRRLKADDRDLFLYCGKAPTENRAEVLRNTIDEYGFGFVVIDTLQRYIRSSDLNDYSKVALSLDPYIRIAHDTKAHLMFVHHAGKGDKEDEMTAVLGSTALFGSVDIQIVLTRDKNGDRHLQTSQRWGTSLEKSVIALDPDTHWPSIEGTSYDARVAEVEEKIRRALECKPPMKREDLEDSVGVGKEVFKVALGVMKKRGELIQTGRGGRGSPHVYTLSRDPMSDFNTEVPDAQQ